MSENTAKRKGIFIYYNMIPVFKQLESGELSKLMLAVLEYSSEGVLPEPISPRADLLFSVMQQIDDADAEKYAEIIEKRREAGLKSAQKRRGEIPTAG